MMSEQDVESLRQITVRHRREKEAMCQERALRGPAKEVHYIIPVNQAPKDPELTIRLRQSTIESIKELSMHLPNGGNNSKTYDQIIKLLIQATNTDLLRL